MANARLGLVEIALGRTVVIVVDLQNRIAWPSPLGWFAENRSRPADLLAYHPTIE
jgi:hypothetical protein